MGGDQRTCRFSARPLERFYEPAQPVNGGDPDDPSTPEAVFFVDMPGTYTVELRVTDNLGLDSVACMNATAVTITAVPERNCIFNWFGGLQET